MEAKRISKVDSRENSERRKSFTGGRVTMTIYLKVKALSKRKPIIDRVSFEITETITTAKALIEYIVRRNVQQYNNKPIDADILPYLTDDDMENGAQIGKIGFGDRKNENKQDADNAVKNALTCFEDGIFRLFIGDEEYGINDKISIKNGDEVTFIRLTMLAGRKW